MLFVHQTQLLSQERTVKKSLCVFRETKRLLKIQCRLQLRHIPLFVLGFSLRATCLKRSQEYCLRISIVIMSQRSLPWAQKSKCSHFIQQKYQLYVGRAEGGCNNNIVLAGKYAAATAFERKCTKAIRKEGLISFIFYWATSPLFLQRLIIFKW